MRCVVMEDAPICIHDYTFAVWDGEQLVPFAKAYSGLTDEEIRRESTVGLNKTQLNVLVRFEA
jgi:hypothetical protein